MGKKYRSDVMESVHQTIESLYSIGLVDNQTMREFDNLCLSKPDWYLIELRPRNSNPTQIVVNQLSEIPNETTFVILHTNYQK